MPIQIEAGRSSCSSWRNGPCIFLVVQSHRCVRSKNFKYDPFGRRIYKSSSSGTSVFACDGDNLTEETNSSGTAVARYSQTQNIDEPLAMLRSSATSYFHADGLGSVTSLSNAAGSIANTYTYDSFGKLTASTGSLVNPFRYTARESDTETGLYYYRARYYDQSSGRFTSEDPSRFTGGIDLYLYVGNNPSVLVDPFGLFPTSWHRNTTLRLAKEVFGPKCADNAKAVADANASVDALPTIGSKISFLFGHYGWERGGPHFPIGDYDTVLLENAVRTCSLNGLGRALHTMQDGFAHGRSPFSPILHYLTGPAMDMMSASTTATTVAATASTYNWLRRYKDQCASCCE
jgi:RHS repeat-associated protein